MSYTVMPKGSILYIEATDPLCMTIGSTSFTYPNANSVTAAGGQNYTQAVASRNFLTESNKNLLKFRRVTEHNRSEFNNRTLRVEQSQRMANGILRKYVVADKQQWDISWSMLPSYRNETVDGAWAAEDLKTFYESAAGRGAFRIKINTSHNPQNMEDSSFWESAANTYNVVFTSCDFTVVKRGIQPFWNVKLSLEQV
jgi:hypothetical protein